MKYRTLGQDLQISAVGLGCMGMSHAYGAPADRKEMRELIASAVDMGYTLFDTAEVYGTPENPHDNEELVGEALKPYRNKVTLATKFGIHFDMASDKTQKPLVPDARPETIRKSVEDSLKRLRTDHIDLYYQHRQDPKIPVEEVAGVMADLMREGKILHWGLSEVGEDIIRRAHKVCPLTAVQNRYSMMARHYEPLFPVLEELSIGLVAFSPMANGFLTGKYDRNSKFDSKTDYRSIMPQFTAEGMEKKSGTSGSPAENSRGKEGKPCADLFGLDDLQEAVDCADSRNTEAEPLGGKCRRRRYRAFYGGSCRFRCRLGAHGNVRCIWCGKKGYLTQHFGMYDSWMSLLQCYLEWSKFTKKYQSLK